MVGVYFLLKQFDLLFGSTGAVYGAGFTDVNVTLWMYRILIGLSILAAIGVAYGISRKRHRQRQPKKPDSRLKRKREEGRLKRRLCLRRPKSSGFSSRPTRSEPSRKPDRQPPKKRRELQR